MGIPHTDVTTISTTAYSPQLPGDVVIERHVSADGVDLFSRESMVQILIGSLVTLSVIFIITTIWLYVMFRRYTLADSVTVRWRGSPPPPQQVIFENSQSLLPQSV